MIHGNSSPTSVPGESADRHVGDFFFRPSHLATPRPLKPFATTTQQIALLRSRGLEIQDEQRAALTLIRLGYFRFSGYAHVMRRVPSGLPSEPESFRQGATFDLIADLAQFDMQWVLRAISAQSDWHRQLKALIASFPAGGGLSLRSAGFPRDWQSLPLWRD